MNLLVLCVDGLDPDRYVQVVLLHQGLHLNSHKARALRGPATLPTVAGSDENTLLSCRNIL